MWFTLKCFGAFYDLVVEPLLEFISGGIIPEIVNVFVFAGIAFIFSVSGTKNWVWPLVLSFFFEEIPLLNLLPGVWGLVTYVEGKQSQPVAEEVPDKQEIVEQQNQEDQLQQA